MLSEENNGREVFPTAYASRWVPLVGLWETSEGSATYQGPQETTPPASLGIAISELALRNGTAAAEAQMGSRG